MEQLLHHLWQYSLFPSDELYMTDGQPFEVIDAGLHNTDSGPDFFNAKIKCQKMLWAGNVEIHQNSSDWYHHRHHTDASYDSVILHVVMNHDAEIYRTNGERIAQFVLPVTERVLKDYAFMESFHVNMIPCAFRLSDINPLFISDWKNALGMERLIQKAQRMRQLVDYYGGDWEEALYILLLRSFGTGINADPFERLARSLPYRFLLKHIDSLLQTEAFLFGQAGFLGESFEYPYYILLQREYHLLSHKFQLKPLPKTIWRFSRLRPSSFPELRIASLALFLHRMPRLFASLLNCNQIEQFRDLFRFELHDFWLDHYQFNHDSLTTHKGLGPQTVESIIINTFIPALYAYGDYMGNTELEERAVDLLMNLSAENNRYVRNWRQAGLSVADAFESQAILQLQKEYCDRKRCLQCRIGHQLLARDGINR